MSKYSPAVLAYRQMARRGGLARAKALTREERMKIARMGGRAGGRGRRKVEQIPPDLAKKIWDLIDRIGGSTLWYMSKAMKRPRFCGPARQILRAIARNGSLEDYQSARELLKCL